MNKKQGKPSIGTFFVGATATVGHVATAGKDTTVRISSNEFYHFSKKDEARIHGTLTNHDKITLVDCVTSTIPGSTSTPNGHSYHANIFPHYIVTGSQHLEPEEPSVGAIEVLIENAHILFWDYAAFGFSLAGPEADRAFLTQITSGKEKPVEVGEHPQVFYFTGKYRILSSQTTLGKIVVSHRPRFTSPTPKGLRVKNSIPIRIEFETPLTFHSALLRANTLLVFLDLLMGTRHSLQSMTIELAREAEDKTRLDVYQSMAPKPLRRKSIENPHPGDVLINGGLQPEVFSEVLASWLARQTDWGNARFRFIQNFRKQNSYTVDRLVAAANLFDILPEGAVGSAPPVSAPLVDATAKAKKIFGELPPSPERDSVLGALGRVGKQTLRSKVAHRARFISERIGQRFTDLDVVVGAAIAARNYFVHGSETKLSHEHCFEFSPFFTDTLEFIFGASDLIEAGWDVEKWNQSGTTLSHPFGRYRTGYGENLANLKAKLNASAP